MFTTLIVPALATRRVVHKRLVVAYVLSILGYIVGLVVSTIMEPQGMRVQAEVLDGVLASARR